MVTNPGKLKKVKKHRIVQEANLEKKVVLKNKFSRLPGFLEQTPSQEILIDSEDNDNLEIKSKISLSKDYSAEIYLATDNKFYRKSAKIKTDLDILANPKKEYFTEIKFQKEHLIHLNKIDNTKEKLKFASKLISIHDLYFKSSDRDLEIDTNIIKGEKRINLIGETHIRDNTLENIFYSSEGDFYRASPKATLPNSPVLDFRKYNNEDLVSKIKFNEEDKEKLSTIKTLEDKIRYGAELIEAKKLYHNIDYTPKEKKNRFVKINQPVELTEEFYTNESMKHSIFYSKKGEFYRTNRNTSLPFSPIVDFRKYNDRSMLTKISFNKKDKKYLDSIESKNKKLKEAARIITEKDLYYGSK